MARTTAIKKLLIWAAGLALLWVIAVLLLQRWILFPSYIVQAPAPPEEGTGGLIKLSVPSPDGAVEGWLLPGQGVSTKTPGPALIFAHGNGEVIDHWPEVLGQFRRMGISVLLPEYRSYGRTPGKPSQQAITEDFVRFYDLLAARPEVDRARIVFMGRSLGGGVVCALAAERPPAAMILMSTFTSVVKLARRYLVPRFLVRDPFDNLKIVSGLRCPLVIFHGRQDHLIPFTHAEKLHEAAPQSKLVAYDDADHNDCPSDWAHFWGEVQRFLTRAGII